VPKLNQIIAIANGKKTQCEAAVTGVYHKLQKADLLTGIARTYKPKDDEGDRLPSEYKNVQYRVGDALIEAEKAWTELFDILATQEYANCKAAADVIVDGQVILPQVPVTYLLFLEKQLLNVQTLISKLPVLDPAHEWVPSDAQRCFSTKPSETTKSKKIPKNHVKYEATKEHPAQVDVFSEDVLVGYWTTINYSGAITEQEKSELLKKVTKLQEAVKMAREEANSVAVEQKTIGKPIFEYLLARK
jgi:hypothetical protein